ncbi:MAG TPA: WecB/TagA/CpsF family glycosyltransferase [Flavisolibacter sp.]|jgi:N-acetylglucosaminyldiphosphoundecaprenol N-acetyl-beta-D-mannosaminyltransferase|nr:WecB/TagA/CpsF family glycosyltransferase [Flavisolibacter sp.]
MNKLTVFSIPVSTGPYAEFVTAIIDAAAAKRSEYVCLANVHMLAEAYRNKEFSNVVRKANIITPDGKPLGWALRLLYGIKQDRVAGVDLTQDLLQAANIKNIPVYFYGGTEDVLVKASALFKVQYPGLQLAGMYSPPFRLLTQQEEDEIVQRINSSGAGIVFVVLGCPKQERWMAAMQGRVNAVSVGIGAALPVMIGNYKRAPSWVRNAGLEWAFRLAMEPKRLFKRYLVTNSLFLYLLAKACFRKVF